jgi:hypothetical protein
MRMCSYRVVWVKKREKKEEDKGKDKPEEG